MQPDEPLLSVRDVTVAFGGVRALDGVGFDVAQGSIAGLIGPNGAGKTSLFNCLSRLYAPRSGSIRFQGRDILRLPAHRMAQLGLGRTFQNLALFADLSVLDNTMVGGHATSAGVMASDALRLPWARRRDSALAQRARETLDWLGLGRVADKIVSDLPFGTQKRVEIARALCGAPKLLALDEPAGGLNHGEVAELGRLICRIRDERGIAVLLVEHHMGLVMAVSDKVVALNFGRKIADGPPAEVRTAPAVIEAYLGEEVTA